MNRPRVIVVCGVLLLVTGLAGWTTIESAEPTPRLLKTLSGTQKAKQ